MINVLKSPTGLSYSENNIIFTLQAKTALGVAFGGKGGSIALQVTEDFDVTDTFYFQFDEAGHKTRIDFTFSNSSTAVNNSNTVLPTFSVFPNSGLLDYLQQVAQKIQKHPLIAPFFVLTVEDDNPLFSIKFTEIDAQEGFQLSLVGTFVQDVDTLATAATATLKPANHRVLIDVFLEYTYKQRDFWRILEIDTPTDEKGIVSIDLKEEINAVLQKEISDRDLLPDFNQNTAFVPKNLYRFYIRYAEKWGDNSKTDWTYLSQDTPFLVRFGGLNQQFFEDYNTEIEALDVLSFYPTAKTITLEQPEFLSYQSTTNGARVKLFVEKIDKNGSVTSTYTTLTAALDKYQTVMLPTGVSQLGIGDDIDIYRCTIVDNSNTPLTTPYTYLIDRNDYESIRFILYINGFGASQTIKCVGDFSVKNNFDKEISEVPNTPSIATEGVGKYTYGVKNDLRFGYRTGYITLKEYHVLLELHNAKRVYEVFQEGYIRLVIDKVSEEVTLSTLPAQLEIVATIAQPINAFSSVNILNVSNDREDIDENNRIAYAIKW